MCATVSSNHIPSRLESCSTVYAGHRLLSAGTFIFATCSSSFGSGYPKITLIFCSIFVLKLTKSDFLAFIAPLHDMLTQGLQRFFCFAVVLGIQLIKYYIKHQ